jgi:hypothetical protein
MMQAHCVGIMAVQETKLMGHLSEFNEFGVQYVGQPAQLQEGTRTGGTGFFVRDAVVPHVSYLGTRPRSRHRAPPKFAPVWLKVFGLEPAHDVHVASVYLPCVGSPRDQYMNALLDLQEDVEHYLTLAHTIFLVGDFNARVGSQASPAVPDALRSVAPLQGETTVNAHGRALLQFCMDNGAEFLSGRTMSAPTCIGHGRNRLTLDVGTSVVDHVLRVRRGKTGPPTLPPCVTLDHATHGPALLPLASDHCPVIFFCGLRTRSAAGKRTSRVTWRLELLHQQQERDAYQLAVRARAHTALGLQATEPGDQHGVDRMASALVDMLTSSAMSALGRRTIVTGI